jgi:hypothetical protein
MQCGHPAGQQPGTASHACPFSAVFTFLAEPDSLLLCQRLLPPEVWRTVSSLVWQHCCWTLLLHGRGFYLLSASWYHFSCICWLASRLPTVQQPHINLSKLCALCFAFIALPFVSVVTWLCAVDGHPCLAPIRRACSTPAVHLHCCFLCATPAAVLVVLGILNPEPRHFKCFACAVAYVVMVCWIVCS